MKKTIIILAIMALAITAGADTFIKQATHQDGFQMQGQTMEPRDDTTITWLSQDKARSDSKEGTIIWRSDIDMVYMIDHEKKAYNEMPLSKFGDLKAMLGMDELSEEEAAMMEQQMAPMMAMMQMSATVTPTEETKKIGDYNCKKYDVDMKMGMINMKSAFWVSKDFDMDYSAFKKLNLAQMLFMPGADQVIKEFEKMDGFMVLSEGEVNMMGTSVKNTTQVLEVVEKDAPEGHFDVPKDYKKEKFDPMSNMR
ncbi:MAG: DUF4412 domain-containing protein [Candidatus Zixiibacteriota bacterium]